MEHLGAWGIIKLSTLIILQNLKHFLWFALLYAFPYVFGLLVFDPRPSFLCASLQMLVAYLSFFYQLTASPNPLPPARLTAFNDAIFSKQLPPFSLSYLVFFFTFSIFISLLCSPPVAFSVCRACVSKNLDLKRSLRAGLRSATSLLLTALCVAAVCLAFCTAAVLIVLIMYTVLGAVNADLAVAMTIWTMAVLGGGLYMAIVLSLADVVAILEEKRGWEAVRRSVYLMKGNEVIAVGLYCGYAALCMVPLFVYCISEEAWVVWRWSGRGASVGLQGFIGLCNMAARVVLYMSSKALREEAAVDAAPMIAAKHLHVTESTALSLATL